MVYPLRSKVLPIRSLRCSMKTWRPPPGPVLRGRALAPPLPAVPLHTELEQVLAQSGPVTFARYMQLALYHPRLGYYAHRVPGRGVTYATSASVGPRFGRYVARELGAMWEALGRPDPFVVTEFGAGYAGLAAAALRVPGEMQEALQWRIVEQFDEIAGLQRRCLGAEARRVAWLRSLDGPPVTGCVIANEVLDNFPFHRFRVDAGGIRELYVAARRGRLVEIPGPVSSESLLDEVPAAGLVPGHRFEVCPGVGDWCRQVSGSLERGYLLVIDYGDEEPDIWRRGPRGTVSTYGERGSGVSPLEDPGFNDITADVDFTALDREARRAGFDFELLTLQAWWLASLGAAGEAADLGAEAGIARAFGWWDDAALLERERDQILRLTDPKGLGGCLVYRASKGLAGRQD